MSKLIVCTGTLMAGGAERVLSILSAPLSNAFDYVEYVLWLDKKSPDVFYKIDPRVRIIKISEESHSCNIFKHLLWFRQHVKKEKPDAILSFMVMINFSVMVSQLFCKTPLFLAERNDPRYFKGSWWLRKMINWMYTFSNVKKVIMQTENNKRYFSAGTQRKVEVIYNPIDMSESYVGSALKQEHSKRIVTVARLEKQKHQHILISAFSEFIKSHPDYTLTFYGVGSLEEELKKQTALLGISSHVSFPGRTNTVYDSIKDATMFVLTSEYEGMSNSLIEAMCLGLPCISTKVSGATDLIQSGDNGVLIDIDDTQGLLIAMTEIADNPVYAKKIGENATQIYQILKSEVISKHWVSCLQQCYTM